MVFVAGCSSTPIASSTLAPGGTPPPGSTPSASSTPAPSSPPAPSTTPTPPFAPPTSWSRVPDAPLLHLDTTSNTVVAVAPDGTFIAIQSALDGHAPVVLHSADAVTWSAAGPLPATRDSQVNAITNDGHGLIAVGFDPAGAVWTLADGLAWRREPDQPTLASEEFERVAAGPNEIIAVLGSGSLASSPDGLSWSVVSVDGTGAAKVSAVTVSDAGFVAVGSVGTRAAAWTSSDGHDWRPATFSDNSNASADLISVAADSQRVVALGSVPSPGDVSGDAWTAMSAWVSADGGATWARTGTAAPALYAPSFPGLYALAGGFIALGNPGPGGIGVWTTRDGIAWQQARIEGAGDDVFGKSLAISGPLGVIGGKTVGTGAGGDRAVFWIGHAGNE